MPEDSPPPPARPRFPIVSVPLLLAGLVMVCAALYLAVGLPAALAAAGVVFLYAGFIVSTRGW
jgi:hypothetical protein